MVPNMSSPLGPMLLVSPVLLNFWKLGAGRENREEWRGAGQMEGLQRG